MHYGRYQSPRKTKFTSKNPEDYPYQFTWCGPRTFRLSFRLSELCRYKKEYHCFILQLLKNKNSDQPFLLILQHHYAFYYYQYRFFFAFQECASEKSYCLAMQKEGLMEDLVKYLNTSSEQLKMLCANAIFRLAEEKESRHLVKYILCILEKPLCSIA